MLEISSHMKSMQKTIRRENSFRFRQNNYNCNCHKHAERESVKQQQLYDHFMLEDHVEFVNDVSIIFIDQTNSTDRLKREKYWKHTLKTLIPNGLNFSEKV